MTRLMSCGASVGLKSAASSATSIRILTTAVRKSPGPSPGANRSWFGSAAGILPALLDLPVATIGLDFVSGRDNWEAVKSVRFDKKLGAGIVDGRNTRIESIEQIEESIRRLSQSVTPDRIYVNPSCGLEYLPRETAFEKLKRMVDGARKAEPVAA